MKFTNEEQNKVKTKIKTLTLLWIILFAELLIALALFYLVFSPDELMPTNNISDQHYLYFSYFSVITFIPASYYIYNKIAILNKGELNPLKKYEKYQIAMIIKYGMYEFAGIFSLISFLITERLEPISMFAMILVIVGLNKPSAYVFRKDYDLMSNDDLFINPEYVENKEDDIEKK